MPEHHPAAEYVKLFPFEDIPGIVQNIIHVCNDLKRQTHGEIENKLSSRLYKKLVWLPAYRTGPLSVVPLWESQIVNFAEENADITGRADILFLFPGGGLETYFLVEAKRLFVTSSKGKVAPLTGKYVEEGMMRFVSGQYASKMAAGAMLGYVFDKPVADAKIALAATVKKRKNILKMTDEGEWQESNISVSPSVDETRHAFDQRAFTIYHILTQV